MVQHDFVLVRGRFLRLLALPVALACGFAGAASPQFGSEHLITALAAGGRDALARVRRREGRSASGSREAALLGPSVELT